MKSYLRKAQHNEKFLAELEKLMPDDYFDWKITVAFYISVHYLSAYFDTHGITIHSHEQRWEKMCDEYIGVTQECLDNYDNLYRLTRNSRYNGFNDIVAYIQHQKAKFKEAKRNMTKIKNFIIDDLDQISE